MEKYDTCEIQNICSTEKINQAMAILIAVFILRRNLRLHVNYVSKTMRLCKICQTKIKASQLKLFVSVSGKTEDR